MKRMVSSTWVVTAAAMLAMTGCSSSTTQARAPENATNAVAPATATNGAAERIVVAAGACWLGGLWTDAVGDVPAARIAGDRRVAADASIARRCHALLSSVYGSSDELEYKQLRAFDSRLVDAIGIRVHAVAQNDTTDRRRADGLVTLLGALADAGRENF
ncbi:MAG TPA: hypothetical protein VIY73_23540, partial [Polyangiaceae bacterium]